LDHDSYPDDYLRAILEEAARSPSSAPAAPRAAEPRGDGLSSATRLPDDPVNPNAAGDRINGETCFATLADVPEPIDMVDVFRRSEAAGDAVDQADRGRCQNRVDAARRAHDAAAARAEAHGLKVVMKPLPAIEIPRLGLPAALIQPEAEVAAIGVQITRRVIPRPGGGRDLCPKWRRPSRLSGNALGGR